MDQPAQTTNLIAELAKRKAEAQKNGASSGYFGKFNSNKSGFLEKAQPIPKRGGRNRQGKP